MRQAFSLEDSKSQGLDPGRCRWAGMNQAFGLGISWNDMIQTFALGFPSWYDSEPSAWDSWAGVIQGLRVGDFGRRYD